MTESFRIITCYPNGLMSAFDRIGNISEGEKNPDIAQNIGDSFYLNKPV